MADYLNKTYPIKPKSLYKIGKNNMLENNFKDYLKPSYPNNNEKMLIDNKVNDLKDLNKPISDNFFIKTSDEEFKLIFVDSELPKNLICGICSQIFQNPIQTKCGHKFCLKCIKNKK